MAQRVDVAIVFRDMLGTYDALLYMADCGIPESVAARILARMAVTRVVPRAGMQAAANDEHNERNQPRPAIDQLVTHNDGAGAVAVGGQELRA